MKLLEEYGCNKKDKIVKSEGISNGENVFEVDVTFKIDNMVPGTVYVLDTAFNEYADLKQ